MGDPLYQEGKFLSTKGVLSCKRATNCIFKVYVFTVRQMQTGKDTDIFLISA